MSDKRQDFISETLKTFSEFNRARTFIQFQHYLKGENLFLQKLEELGGESTPTALAHELDLTGPRVASIVRSLEMKKLVKRRRAADDKRKTFVTITMKGREWVSLADSETATLLSDMMDRLGEEDSKELLRIMRKLLGVEKGSSGKDSTVGRDE